MPDRDAAAARRRIRDYLRKARALGGPAAILGGEDLPPTLVFECVVEVFPERRVVHLDADERPDRERIRQLVARSFQPGHLLLATVTRRAGRDYFRFLEALVRERRLEVPDDQGWKILQAPEGWMLVVHSPAGPFPFDERIPARLAL